MSTWKSTPGLVEQLTKEGSTMFKRIRAAIKTLPNLQPDYGHVWFNPRNQVVHFTPGDGDEELLIKDWITTLRDVKGVKHVTYQAETPPNKKDGPWLRVKQAELQDVLGPLAQAGGWKEGPVASLFKGPNPLSAMIASRSFRCWCWLWYRLAVRESIACQVLCTRPTQKNIGISGRWCWCITWFVVLYSERQKR